jgi:hypothetical protein
MNTSERVALDPTERVASDLVHTMCAANGLNEFFENALPPIAGAFGAGRVILIDYQENTNHFDLLHFGGVPEAGKIRSATRSCLDGS